MSEQTSVIQADALRPASMRESTAFVRQLPSKPRLLPTLALALCFGTVLLSMVGGSWVIGRLFDIFRGGHVPLLGSGNSAFWRALIVIMVLQIGDQVARGLARYIIAAFMRRFSIDLRRACLHAALTAPIPKIQALGTGNVITRLTKDVDETVRIANEIGMRLILAVLMFPASLLALLVIDIRLGASMLVAGVLVAPFLKRTIAKIPIAANIVSSQQAHRNNILLDTLRGIPTIRAFGLQNWADRRLRTASWKSIEAESYIIPVNSLLLFQATGAYVLFVILTFLEAAWLGHQGSITGGEAAAAMLIVLRMEMPIFNVLTMIGSIQQATTALGRAVALAQLQADGPSNDPEDITQPPAIVLQQLRFGYDPQQPILHDIDLELAPGTTTAVVGASGAGKSTLAALIAGLLQPTSGTITIGGQDTAAVSDVWTARQVTFMNQDVHLFAGSLAHDLRMAQPEATDQQLLAALAEVGLAADSPEFQRNFPEGLDTLVGAGANELPAAVAQQVSLARVLLRQPPVLIMDEATSEAGSDYARTLEAAATAVSKQRTTLVVAHRLDQAMKADRVLVMREGRIVEDGTHEQLLAANGPYSQLFGHWSGTL